MKAIFKYNGGYLALICSSCSVTIKTGKDFNLKELRAIKGVIEMPPRYCSKCKTKQSKSVKHEGHKTTKQDMPQVQDGEDKGRV